MGILSWLLAGAIAAFAARFIPFGRRPGWKFETLVTLSSASFGGFIATALDFGGLDEPDPRAWLFAGLVALASLGIVRLGTVARPNR